MFEKFKKLKIIGMTISGLAVIAMLGPGPKDITYKHHALSLPQDLAGLENYLEQRESRFSDITPGTKKKITWYGKKNQKTEYSVMYLHGYSATRQEISPVQYQIAEKMKANLFETRLAGHGRGEKLSEATVDQWLEDADEALQISRKLGNKIIIIGVSTGVPLAIWIAKQDQAESVHAMVFASANFGPKDESSKILLWPWGRVLVKIFIGEYYSWKPANEKHATYWTYNYPSSSLIDMMSLVEYTSNIKLEKIQIPTLFLYTEHDTVVDTKKIANAYERLGAKHKKLVNLKNAKHHVIAGDIRAPHMNARVLKEVLEFVNSINNAS